ncbi:hypothetical protein [Fulvivirga sedimenti]|uniref:DegT/DnrJ/EryC1/StrS aminotransferase family protein n=1 Tax=Fulvivirga sedimenti TaxID=2879465 RepID=A0A9X1KV58_9BACT|nr:hypothetical protein [Fulvivirga sedimenti]MCA6073430.1 hypothetical protein [Fulvivirga sedimenti]
MISYGGYFGFENDVRESNVIKDHFLMVNGRSALFLILKIVKPTKVYIPFYICDSVIDSFHEARVPISFYEINEQFELKEIPSLRETEMLLYVNYFGIKENYSRYLNELLNGKLILDATQSFNFDASLDVFQFNSLRKYFGVPDGAEIHIPSQKHGILERIAALANSTDYLIDHLQLRNEGKVQEGYEFYKINEQKQRVSLRRASELTNRIYQNISVDKLNDLRRSNFMHLHDEIGILNKLKIPEMEYSVPIYYPLLPKSDISHQELWAKQVYAPILWPEILRRKFSDSFPNTLSLAERIIPVPIDHRIGKIEISLLAEIIRSIHGR